MNKPDWRLYGAAFAVGLLLVPVRFVVMFFPGFNVGEILLFGGAAVALAWFFRAKPSWWVLLVFVPVFLIVLYTVAHLLGADKIRQGIGTGHAVSLLLIPLSTFAGAYYGHKLTRRPQPAF